MKKLWVGVVFGLIGVAGCGQAPVDGPNVSGAAPSAPPLPESTSVPEALASEELPNVPYSFLNNVKNGILPIVLVSIRDAGPKGEATGVVEDVFVDDRKQFTVGESVRLVASHPQSKFTFEAGTQVATTVEEVAIGADGVTEVRYAYTTHSEYVSSPIVVRDGMGQFNRYGHPTSVDELRKARAERPAKVERQPSPDQVKLSGTLKDGSVTTTVTGRVGLKLDLQLCTAGTVTPTSTIEDLYMTTRCVFLSPGAALEVKLAKSTVTATYPWPEILGAPGVDTQKYDVVAIGFETGGSLPVVLGVGPLT